MHLFFYDGADIKIKLHRGSDEHAYIDHNKYNNNGTNSKPHPQ